MAKHRPRRRISLYVAHRWIGALASLFVLFMAATGLVLNHAVDWQLDRRPVRVSALLDAYGIDIPPPERGFRVGAHWISASAGTAYWNDRPAGLTGTLIGVAHHGGLTLVVGRDAALLLDGQGVVLERSAMSGWPTPITGLRASAQGFIALSSTGAFLTDTELLVWEPHALDGSESRLDEAPLPAALAQQVRADARARSISWERVLLDLHSGRLLGRAGVLIADLVALALMGLALSGLGLWIRHLRRQHAHRLASDRRRAGP